jgi:hypothetical protein
VISTGSIDGRANYIIFFTLMGFFLLKGRKYNKVIISASLFTLYIMLYTLLEGAENIKAYMASSIIWPIMLFITYNIRFTDKDIDLIAYIGAITCNISAYLYITLTNMDMSYISDQNLAIAGYNSIYYILLLLPFVFLIKNKFHVFVLMLLPTYSFVTSEKATCILATIIVICYYSSTIKQLKISQKIIIMIGSVIFACILFYFFNLTNMLLSIQEDIASGGNGRMDIISLILDKYFNQSSIIEQFLGHGTSDIGAHNDFIEILYKYGLVGFGLYIYIWYNLLKSVKLLDSNPKRKAAYVISLIIFAFTCMASRMIGTQMQMIILSIFWGVILQHKYVKYAKVSARNLVDLLHS